MKQPLRLFFQCSCLSAPDSDWGVRPDGQAAFCGTGNGSGRKNVGILSMNIILNVAIPIAIMKNSVFVSTYRSENNE